MAVSRSPETSVAEQHRSFGHTFVDKVVSFTTEPIDPKTSRAILAFPYHKLPEDAPNAGMTEQEAQEITDGATLSATLALSADTTRPIPQTNSLRHPRWRRIVPAAIVVAGIFLGAAYTRMFGSGEQPPISVAAPIPATATPRPTETSTPLPIVVTTSTPVVETPAAFPATPNPVVTEVPTAPKLINGATVTEVLPNQEQYQYVITSPVPKSLRENVHLLQTKGKPVTSASVLTDSVGIPVYATFSGILQPGKAGSGEQLITELKVTNAYGVQGQFLFEGRVLDDPTMARSVVEGEQIGIIDAPLPSSFTLPELNQDSRREVLSFGFKQVNGNTSTRIDIRNFDIK